MKSNATFKERDVLADFIEHFSFKLFWYIVKRTITLILVLLLLAFLIPFVYNRYSIPVFQTNASIIKKKESDNNLLLDNSNKLLLNEGQEKLNRDVQILSSEVILKKIVDSVYMKFEYFKQGRISINKTELYLNSPFYIELSDYKIKNPALYSNTIFVEISPNNVSLQYKINAKLYSIDHITSGQLIDNSDIRCKIIIKDSKDYGRYIVRCITDDDIINLLKSNIIINHDENNIYIKTKNQLTVKSEVILNQLINAFLAYDKNENSEKIENSLKFINAQLDTFYYKYNEIQQQKNNFIRKTNIYNPETQVSTNLALIQESDNKMSELNQNLKSIEFVKNSIANNKMTPESILSNNIDDKSGVARELEILLSNRNKMLLDYKPNHPLILSVNEQIETKNKALSVEMRNKIKNYEFQIQNIRQRISNSKLALNENSDNNATFSKFEKEIELIEKYISNLQDKQNQFLIMKSSIVSDYIILDHPKSILTPISPQKKLSYILAFFVFILSSLGSILYRYIKFDKIVSLASIKRETNVPILGILPVVKEAQDLKAKNSSSPLSKIVVLNNSKSRISEAFKKIRADMKYLPQKDYKIVATTSTVSGEGKTFVLINLAMVHALLDKKVIILDLDLRKPRIAKSFNLDNTKGMSKILSNNATIDECIQKMEGTDNLDVITSGPVPPNPSELILNARFNEILDELKSRYDYIFIDTPPVGLVNESIEIINRVDIPIYIIRSNYSKLNFIENLNELYGKKEEKNLYIIFNHFGDGASGYVNYGYGYGYGYGNTYGKEYSDKHEGYYTNDKNVDEEKWYKKILKWDL